MVHARKWCAHASALVLLLTACSPGATQPSPSQSAAASSIAAGTIRIAVISGFTGPGAVWGNAIRRNWEMKAEDVNAAGGVLVGDQRYMVELVPTDDQYDSTLSRTAGERHAADGIRFFGMDGDPGASSQIEISTNEKIIVIHTSTDETVGPAPYMFMTINPPWTLEGPLLRTVKEHYPDATKVVAMAPNISFDFPLRDLVPQVVEDLDLGLEYAGVTFGEPGQDWSPVVNRVLAQDPDILMLGCFGDDELAVLRLIRDLGYQNAIIGGPCQSVPNEVFIEAIGADYLEGRYWKSSPVPSPMTGPTKEFYDRFVSDGTTWVDLALQYWYGPALFFTGLEAAGTIDDPDAIMAAMSQAIVKVTVLEGEPEVGTWGEEVYGLNNHLDNWAFMTGFQDGEFVIEETRLPEH